VPRTRAHFGLDANDSVAQDARQRFPTGRGSAAGRI